MTEPVLDSVRKRQIIADRTFTLSESATGCLLVPSGRGMKMAGMRLAIGHVVAPRRQ